MQRLLSLKVRGVRATRRLYVAGVVYQALLMVALLLLGYLTYQDRYGAFSKRVSSEDVSGEHSRVESRKTE